MVVVSRIRGLFRFGGMLLWVIKISGFIGFKELLLVGRFFSREEFIEVISMVRILEFRVLFEVFIVLLSLLGVSEKSVVRFMLLSLFWFGLFSLLLGVREFGVFS